MSISNGFRILSVIGLGLAFGIQPAFADQKACSIALTFQALSQDDRSPIHPDLVKAHEIEDLQKGEVVYFHLPAFAKKTSLSIQCPPKSCNALSMQAKVTSVQFVLNEKNERAVTVSFESIATRQRFTAQGTDLLGVLYRDSNFEEHAPFEYGDYVRVGRYQKEGITAYDHKGEAYALKVGERPLLGQFRRAEGVDQYVVALLGVVPLMGEGSSMAYNAVVRVNRYEVSALVSGSEARALERIQKVSAEPYWLKAKQTVRYRDSHGAMQIGQVLDVPEDLDDKIVILDSKRRERGVPRKSVFALVSEGDPKSMRYENAVGYGRENSVRFNTMSDPSPLFIEFLDGGARLSSYPEFKRYSDKKRFQTLLKYLLEVVPYEDCMKGVESTMERRGLADLVKMGGAVCRHHAPMLASLLEETGYRTRLVSRFAIRELGETEGHEWVEATGTDGQRYVIDASEQRVESTEEAWREARRDPKSSAALWWTHERRQFESPKDVIERF